jgi:hypothetical protein
MAGLNAAYPLVMGGAKVLMLDAGATPVKKFGLKYPLLGRRAGYAERNVEKGRIITKSYVAGGLSEIWGGACARFNLQELHDVGLPTLEHDYNVVSQRIGLRGGVSSWRGHMMLQELCQHPNFEYRKQLVTEIPPEGIVVVACGAINTAKLIGAETLFYKSNRLQLCLSFKRRSSHGSQIIETFEVGTSFVLLYGLAPHVVVADTRGPRVPMRQFGLLPLFSWQFPEGSASHYAGGVKVDSEGRWSDRVYVADAASWTALPAKPPSLTIMANANRIGRIILNRLKKES